MLLVAIFFVSGADAASIVMGTLSEKGTLEPSKKTVIFWGAATGAVAAVMLLIGGEDALSGLQNVTIVAALPFLVIMVGLAVALVKDLSADPQVVRRQMPSRPSSTPSSRASASTVTTSRSRSRRPRPAPRRRARSGPMPPERRS